MDESKDPQNNLESRIISESLHIIKISDYSRAQNCVYQNTLTRKMLRFDKFLEYWRKIRIKIYMCVLEDYEYSKIHVTRFFRVIQELRNSLSEYFIYLKGVEVRLIELSNIREKYLNTVYVLDSIVKKVIKLA